MYYSILIWCFSPPLWFSQGISSFSISLFPFSTLRAVVRSEKNKVRLTLAPESVALHEQTEWPKPKGKQGGMEERKKKHYVCPVVKWTVSLQSPRNQFANYRSKQSIFQTTEKRLWYTFWRLCDQMNRIVFNLYLRKWQSTLHCNYSTHGKTRPTSWYRILFGL